MILSSHTQYHLENYPGGVRKILVMFWKKVLDTSKYAQANLSQMAS